MDRCLLAFLHIKALHNRALNETKNTLISPQGVTVVHVLICFIRQNTERDVLSVWLHSLVIKSPAMLLSSQMLYRHLEGQRVNQGRARTSKATRVDSAPQPTADAWRGQRKRLETLYQTVHRLCKPLPSSRKLFGTRNLT